MRWLRATSRVSCPTSSSRERWGCTCTPGGIATTTSTAPRLARWTTSMASKRSTLRPSTIPTDTLSKMKHPDQTQILEGTRSTWLTPGRDCSNLQRNIKDWDDKIMLCYIIDMDTVPAGTGVHVRAPGCEYVPAGHGLHELEGSVDATYPAMQFSHTKGKRAVTQLSSQRPKPPQLIHTYRCVPS